MNRLFCCVWLVAVSCLGCGGILASNMAREAPPAAINATLQALNEAENQRLMARLMRAPELREAARAFAGEVGDGALTTLTEPERLARIEEMSTRYIATLTRAITRSMAAGLQQDLAPAIAATMRATVASTLREVLREGYQRDLERVATGLTRATVEAAGRGMAESMARDMGPALQAALANDQTTRSLSAIGRALGREVVLGSNDAMTQIQRAQERSGRTTFLSRVSSITESGAQIFKWVAIAAVFLSLALALWVARLILRLRRIQAERERNAASAVMLAEGARA